jgi:Pyruvate/2-oxoacid:ferredoxin oxidoreductase gamma subunit
MEKDNLSLLMVGMGAIGGVTAGQLISTIYMNHDIKDHKIIKN